MKGNNLGELEELIMLVAATLFNEAYGVAIKEELEKTAGRKVNISAIHATLNRLEEKGLVVSRMGGATAERGGRRKRLFTVTAEGQQALAESRELRNGLWKQIPDVAFKFGIA